ncbi:peptide chain release factor N(5)-glutamine methyltransferase [Salicibibacter cibarius]|uniref:Release factor glutamine methyltransferase n=1 Tax=Salicibibacter cibarius TaxID=2743000 RepID=A0A7T6Z7A6_9BACI|nr:peptide chain release factor N(5)-glutamine methyltransferase [Salicibibacter cibarius]QQK77997.1 peptide chain release factor N(5)-glutamine methyltransferase [Salicibibacter cibarius]
MHSNNGQGRSASPPRVSEALQWASSFFQEKGMEKKAAEYLMQDLLQLDNVAYHLHLREKLSDEQWGRYKAWAERHGEGEPVQYITGGAYFYGRRFSVNPSVLIPRQETEELVELVIAKAQKRFQRPAIADVGTGSGAIAITLALEWPEATVSALDASREALAIARKNGEGLGASSLAFIEGDMLRPLRDQGMHMDVIVANPPYIATREWRELDLLVRGYEPRQALDGGGDGLFFYRKLAEGIPYVLSADGLAIFEIGEMQGPSVMLLMEQQLPGANIDIVQDINGKDRFVMIER